MRCTQLLAHALILFFASIPSLLSQQPFARHCASCHGDDARGTSKAPGLANNPRVAEQSPEQLRAYLEHGNPGSGMPAFGDLPGATLISLAQYLRHINIETL